MFAEKTTRGEDCLLKARACEYIIKLRVIFVHADRRGAGCICAVPVRNKEEL